VSTGAEPVSGVKVRPTSRFSSSEDDDDEEEDDDDEMKHTSLSF